ncbi:MAG: histidine kinase [Proteobacteria bacterium]|nr:histidine kinase [Pseudomonadota bacterium]
MNTRLRILHLEDADLDHALILAFLGRGGLHADVQRVADEAGFRAALAQGPWDIVLSDYNLPGFSGLKALRLVRELPEPPPFILVSGEIGEDVAVAAMRNGASDYLLKGNLARLAPAIEHALAGARAQRAKQEADAQLAASRQRLSELAQHLQTSVEMERAAIAREIHDDVGGSLTALKLELAWLQRQSGTPPEMRARLDSALETVTHALDASKRIMHNLRPAILEQGLVAALQWMAQRFEKRSGMPCTFHSSRLPEALPPGVALAAYRTAQEALTNISKHAQAQNVSLDLAYADGVLSLEIHDDGVGLTEADLAKARSFGIRGLHERAGTVGGWVDLTSRPGRGTTLMLSIPLDTAAQDAAGEAEPDAHDPSVWGSL